MPITVNANLPAVKTLSGEGIFVMTNERASHQDIRPLNIAILNIMPTKIDTETQLLRLIGNTPIQVEVTLLYPATHDSKNTPIWHLNEFYKTYDDIKTRRFDGMIITGAPVELLEFEEVDYLDELNAIMKWSKKNVFSTLHICWGAQAGLYYHYGIKKYPLPKKISGVFKHRLVNASTQLTRGFDDVFYAPHSRNSGIRMDDILACGQLDLISVSDEAGPYIIMAKNGRQIFVTGHSEYDPYTLKNEYERDIGRGLDVGVPKNYYPGDDPSNPPCVRWRGHANLLFSNWLNYYVYQQTPYDLFELDASEL